MVTGRAPEDNLMKRFYYYLKNQGFSMSRDYKARPKVKSLKILWLGVLMARARTRSSIITQEGVQRPMTIMLAENEHVQCSLVARLVVDGDWTLDWSVNPFTSRVMTHLCNIT